MRLVSLSGYAGPGPWSGLKDDGDAAIWQTAVIAQAQYVVSHNLADFPPLVNGHHAYEGIEYLTAAEFISNVLGEDVEETYGATLPPEARSCGAAADPRGGVRTAITRTKVV